LRAVGFTAEQFGQSVRGLDQLLAWEIARRQDPMPARRPCESVRQWLARASGRHTYLMYVAVLGQLAPATPATKVPLKRLEQAVVRRHAPEIRRLLAAHPFAAIGDGGGVAETGTQAQAGALAVRMIERANACTTAKFGSEASLCDDFDTSRSLMRQALRILQDLDLIGVQLGRGGGYTLKQPSPIGVVRQVFAWLAARNCCPLALTELMWDLNAANLRLAGERLWALPSDERERHCAEFERIVVELRGQERFMRLQQALAHVADCPVIATLARCVVSYQARSYGDFPEHDLNPLFDRLERAIVRALRWGDVDLAERTLRTLQRRAYRCRLESFGFAAAAE
jgi:DNA-binding FadR family transcriptional regulator